MLDYAGTQKLDPQFSKRYPTTASFTRDEKPFDDALGLSTKEADIKTYDDSRLKILEQMEQCSEMVVLYDSGIVVTLERKNVENSNDNIISTFTTDNHTAEPTFQHVYQQTLKPCHLANLDNKAMIAIWLNSSDAPFVVWLWNVQHKEAVKKITISSLFPDNTTIVFV